MPMIGDREHDRRHDQHRDEQHLCQKADEPRLDRLGRHAIGNLLDRRARDEQHERRQEHEQRDPHERAR